MTDSCIICECEPIDDTDWYRCDDTMEVVCPWCVRDFRKIRQICLEQDEAPDYNNIKLRTIRKC